ncbi:DUF2064 domain-containing protein [Flavobacteriaceae bacterium F89]|uniref:DUF2064 domain-containing protein n=1 Tax=Cerina litoralis TaxID=2874477 RepID=A0AAE3JR01_9FLAO|nr:DUF2064 domain-containing protein [Cerina litoralis]MCG2462691.1 DUF2064 domain-containing protein [Cerina litoralis]
MNFSSKNTALLVFSFSAELETNRKYIFGKGHKKENITFFKFLLAQTKKLAAQSGADVFWVDEHQQTGVDFSMRFTNAFQKLFDAGYENVVSIGNDCPDLSSELLQEAIEKLRQRNMILGPSKDGGVYLLGMNSSAFDREKFQNLPWQTPSLQMGLRKYVDLQNLDFNLLEELNDLDSGKDVRQYSICNPLTLLSLFFKAIVSSIKSKIRILNDFIPASHRSSYFGLRAPPKV